MLPGTTGEGTVATRAHERRRVILVFLGERAPTGEALGIQRAGSDSGLDGAAGFLGVTAVAEPAQRGKVCDLGDARVQLITKPFTYADLATRVREVLDQDSG